MNRFIVVAIVLLIIAGLILGCITVVSLTNTEWFDVLRAQVEADNARAKADEATALAELTEEQAKLEMAAGERELKRGQAEALTIAAGASASTVETSNRLVTLWGISFPALPPVYLTIGAAFGVLIGGFAGYSFGVSKALATRPPETEMCVVPEPDVIGA